MRKYKYRREHFLLFDYVGVEEHLQKMAAKGWFLTKIEHECWTYEKRKPARLRYSVTYIEDASEFDPINTESKDKLDEFCEMAGWEKVADWSHMQIYCTENWNAIDIDTDESVRLKAIRKSMKNTILITNCLMLVVFLMNGFSQYKLYADEPARYFAQYSSVILLLILISGVLFILTNLAYYFIWSYLSGKSVAAGGTCVRVKGYRILSQAFIVWILFWSVLFFLSLDREAVPIGLVTFLGILLIAFLIRKVSIILRNKGIDRGSNVFITIALDIVLVGVLMVCMVGYVFYDSEEMNPGVEIYQIENTQWEVYHDNIPVTIEQLIPIDYQHYSYETVADTETFLVSDEVYRQQSFPDGHNAPSMTYEVINVKADFLYDTILNNLLEKNPGDSLSYRFYEVDISDWSVDKESPYHTYVDKVYKCDSSVSHEEWILCQGNTILWIRTDLEMTEDQLKTMLLHVSRYYPIEEDAFDMANTEYQLEGEGYEFSDGTYAQLWENPVWGYHSYRLEEGIKVLDVYDCEFFSGQPYQQLDVYPELDEDAKLEVKGFLDKLENGYNLEQYLNIAYADYQTCQEDELEFETHVIRTDEFVEFFRNKCLTYETSTMLPADEHYTGIVNDYRQVYYFDIETGENIEPIEFFTVSEAEVKELFTQLRADSNMEADKWSELFKLEYIFFRDEIVEVWFPAGVAGETSTGHAVSYDELASILQSWVLPENNE